MWTSEENYLWKHVEFPDATLGQKSIWRRAVPTPKRAWQQMEPKCFCISVSATFTGRMGRWSEPYLQELDFRQWFLPPDLKWYFSHALAFYETFGNLFPLEKKSGRHGEELRINAINMI